MTGSEHTAVVLRCQCNYKTKLLHDGMNGKKSSYKLRRVIGCRNATPLNAQTTIHDGAFSLRHESFINHAVRLVIIASLLTFLIQNRFPELPRPKLTISTQTDSHRVAAPAAMPRTKRSGNWRRKLRYSCPRINHESKALART